MHVVSRVHHCLHMSVFYIYILSICVCLSICVLCCVADYKRGFGGQYGVEVEKQDQCALGYEHKERLAKHESQKGTEPPLNPPTPTCPPFIKKTILCFLILLLLRNS